jgi:hypothetical protein
MHISPNLRGLTTAAGLAATVLAVAAPTAAAARHDPDVPAVIAVPAGHKEFLSVHADGVQIYRCTATTDGAGWVLTAPRATLRDRKGKAIGTHFAGPTWQAKDGSSVVGRRVDGVTVDPTAVPWLLLEAASTTAGQKGSQLTQTTYIQRTATVGGLAPAAGTCTAATVGSTAEVPYTADYHFWKAQPGRWR